VFNRSAGLLGSTTRIEWTKLSDNACLITWGNFTGVASSTGTLNIVIDTAANLGGYNANNTTAYIIIFANTLHQTGGHVEVTNSGANLVLAPAPDYIEQWANGVIYSIREGSMVITVVPE